VEHTDSQKFLLPYQTLTATVEYVSKQLAGKTATVNYEDIGILSQRDNFFYTHAITVNGSQWLIGVFFSDFVQRQNNSYIYGFAYDWRELFAKARPNVTPRLMPTHGANALLDMNSLFSSKNAYASNNNGIIEAPHNKKRRFVNITSLTSVVMDNMKVVNEARRYDPQTPSKLAPIIYRAISLSDRVRKLSLAKLPPTQD